MATATPDTTIFAPLTRKFSPLIVPKYTPNAKSVSMLANIDIRNADCIPNALGTNRNGITAGTDAKKGADPSTSAANMDTNLLACP